MKKETQPWFKFYPRDWRSDQALRICSLGARGVWMEMLCVMHAGHPYGHMTINGVPATVKQIAALCGINEEVILPLLGELESAGVFSRNHAGTIYSRRMARDELRRKDGEKTQKIGTIPSSRRGKQLIENNVIKFPPPEVGDQPPPLPPMTQSPESRVQKEEKEKKISKRNSRIDPDWKPDSNNIAYAISKGIPARDIQDVTEQFVNHHLAKGNLYADWSAAWKNWARRSKDFGPKLFQRFDDGRN